MRKLFKFLLAVTVVLLLFVAAGVWLLSRVDTKAQFEAAASKATGLQVVVRGEVVVSLMPALGATLTQVTVRNRGTPIAAVGEAEVALEFLPLLRREVRVRRLVLRGINAQVERDAQGNYNFEVAPGRRQAQSAALVHAAASVAALRLENTNLRFIDRGSDQEVSVNDCEFRGEDVELLAGNSSQLLKNLTFAAGVACAEVRTRDITATDVKFELVANRGVFQLKSLLLGVLGGEGSGDVDVDLRAAQPAYRIEYSVSQLQLKELFKLLSSPVAGEGQFDFNTSLTMQGGDLDALLRTARGAAMLQGRDLKLAVGNLDEKLARYESSQNFNLVDVGAFFIAGPVGPALTKSYNFASIFRGTGETTTIRNLMSRWSIGDGIAQAQDVALATRANRMAVKGAVDYVNQTFNEMSVALLTEGGCARVEQKISGTFAAPQIKRPSVLGALAGPVKSLVGKAKRLLGMDCEVFYEGSIEP